MTTLQRRLASSPEAIYRSLRCRRERLENRPREERLLKRGAEAGLELSSDAPPMTDEDLEELDDAPLATRREFVEALRSELPTALKNLQHGSIAPVDLAQAAIGPGMVVFSRYSKVLETDGSAMRVRTALGLINQTLDEILAEQESEYGEETRWALAWFEQYRTSEGKFGDAETLSRAKDTAVDALEEAGIIKAKAGKAQLVPRETLSADWDPASEKRLTIWELTQHLIRALVTGGETEAARIIRRVGSLAEISKDLAYRLYVICDRKGWPQEALGYNMLVKSWPELLRLAAGSEGESARLL